MILSRVQDNEREARKHTQEHNIISMRSTTQSDERDRTARSTEQQRSNKQHRNDWLCCKEPATKKHVQ